MRPIIEPPDIAEYADIIKERVTIEEAVRFYFNATPRHNRIPCPLHGGKDLNFSFKRNFYRCFVCGKSGDVITLVRDYFGLSFPDAVKKLNDDFRIGLAVDGGGSIDPTALRAAAELRRRRQDDWREGAIETYLADKAVGDFVCIRELTNKALAFNGMGHDPSVIESKDIGMIMARFPEWERVGKHRFSDFGQQRAWQKTKMGEVLPSEADDFPF